MKSSSAVWGLVRHIPKDCHKSTRKEGPLSSQTARGEREFHGDTQEVQASGSLTAAGSALHIVLSILYSVS